MENVADKTNDPFASVMGASRGHGGLSPVITRIRFLIKQGQPDQALKELHGQVNVPRNILHELVLSKLSDVVPGQLSIVREMLEEISKANKGWHRADPLHRMKEIDRARITNAAIPRLENGLRNSPKPMTWGFIDKQVRLEVMRCAILSIHNTEYGMAWLISNQAEHKILDTYPDKYKAHQQMRQAFTVDVLKELYSRSLNNYPPSTLSQVLKTRLSYTA